MKRKVSTQSGRYGKASKIVIDVPVSITMFHNMFLHKLKLPVQNVKKFDIGINDLKKLLGPDWLTYNTANTGTQVKLAGLISIHHRKKIATNFRTGKCGR